MPLSGVRGNARIFEKSFIVDTSQHKGHTLSDVPLFLMSVSRQIFLYAPPVAAEVTSLA